MITRLTNFLMSKIRKEPARNESLVLDNDNLKSSEVVNWKNINERFKQCTVGSERCKYIKSGIDCCKPCIFIFEIIGNQEWYCVKYNKSFSDQSRIPPIPECTCKHLSHININNIVVHNK